MTAINEFSRWLVSGDKPYKMRGKLWSNGWDIFSGRRTASNTQKSVQAQISYNDYIKAGNQRAYDDWMRNVGKYGRTIRYPELSYPGRIYQADTASARAMYDADTAYANYSGNLPFRIAGLYGIGSRVSRWL